MDLENEGLILTGRLAASIVHEINNPMQAIRGALALTLEEIDDREAVRAYTELCLQETDRVVHLASLLRQVYRPDTKRTECVDLNQVIRDVLTLGRDELNRQRIEVSPVYAPGRLALEGNPDKLVLALLYLLLFLIPRLAEGGGRKIQIQTSQARQEVQVEIAIPGPDLPDQAGLLTLLSQPVPPNPDEGYDEAQGSLAPLHTVISSHHGQVQLTRLPGSQVIGIRFPSQPPA